ncbi:tetratricopeptide repeat protein [Streptomyces arboris]|uniref:tetratricopeptide repeat protein n=1 Tax=Streptomyces arboris TaxID=2600619 RepID=UPI003C2E35D5
MVRDDGAGPYRPDVENRLDGQAGTVVQAGVLRGDVHIHAERTAAPVPRQLPMGTRHFTGRAAETAWLDAVVADASPLPALAVVSGTAGVGKSALVLAWAHRVVDAFPDGHLYIDLCGYGPEQPVPAYAALAGFLRALGETGAESDTTPEDRAARYRTAVSGRRLLIVLDNAASEEQVRPLLPGVSSSVVVVTSRRPLTGLAVQYAAKLLPVGRLPTRDAVELLERSLGERVSLEREAAASLARRCTGLPLALRIAAEHAADRPALPLSALAAELDDERTRLDVLDSGDDPRSAVRTVFSWSYHQLGDEAGGLFRMLGLHPGYGVDAYAAAALTGIGTDIGPGGGTVHRTAVALLMRLARAQMIAESTSGRFDIHDLLRVYARELGEALDDDTARQASLCRLFDYYLHTADRADRVLNRHRYRMPLDGVPSPGPRIVDHGDALRWLDAERRNLVALCRLDRPELDGRRWQLAYVLRGYFFLTKRWDDWIETHTLALAACRRSGDRGAEAITHNNLGRAMLESGRHDDAAEHYACAVRLYEEVGDRHGLSDMLANRAVMLRGQGRYAEALRDNHEALDFYRQEAAARKIAITLRAIALNELGLGRLADAERHVEEALDGFLGLELHQEVAKGFSTLGLVLHRAGEDHRAQEAYLRAVDVARRCGSTYEEARALHRLGAVAAARPDTEAARCHWTRALTLYQGLGSAKADRVAADLATLDR